MRSVKAVVVGVCALGLLGGCASSRTKDRVSVLEAENIDLRQRGTLLESQIQEAHSAQDAAIANLQVKESQLRKAQMDAAKNAEAAGRLAQAQSDYERVHAELAQANARVASLEAQRARPVGPPGPTTIPHRESEQVEAFRRDLQEKLSRAGVHVPVEVRTTRAGERRVAVVLQDAFPPGKDNLASNAKAVEAVARLGEMIKDSYPQSRVHIEGHTDSDPIRKSNWESNDALAKARAEAVKKLLLGVGLVDGRVETDGVGSKNPIARGNTTRAKAQNRRVEIYVSPE
jgi:flagellar motor protein MotB